MNLVNKFYSTNEAVYRPNLETNDQSLSLETSHLENVSFSDTDDEFETALNAVSKIIYTLKRTSMTADKSRFSGGIGSKLGSAKDINGNTDGDLFESLPSNNNSMVNLKGKLKAKHVMLNQDLYLDKQVLGSYDASDYIENVLAKSKQGAGQLFDRDFKNCDIKKTTKTAQSKGNGGGGSSSGDSSKKTSKQMEHLYREIIVKDSFLKEMSKARDNIKTQIRDLDVIIKRLKQIITTNIQKLNAGVKMERNEKDLEQYSREIAKLEEQLANYKKSVAKNDQLIQKISTNLEKEEITRQQVRERQRNRNRVIVMALGYVLLFFLVCFLSRNWFRHYGGKVLNQFRANEVLTQR